MGSSVFGGGGLHPVFGGKGELGGTPKRGGPVPGREISRSTNYASRGNTKI